MGVVEIVCFALCWVFVAVVMLWAVFTEDRRSEFDARFAYPIRRRFQPSSPRRPDEQPRPAAGPTTPPDWVLVATIDGASDEAESEAHLVLTAWLAAWGVDDGHIQPGDVRTQQVHSDGADFTQVLVHASALPKSHRHRLGG